GEWCRFSWDKMMRPGAGSTERASAARGQRGLSFEAFCASVGRIAMTTLPFPTLLLRLRLLPSCIACPALVSLAAGEEAPSQKTGEKFLPEGQFVWHEIVTPDPGAAEKFYSSVFDWKVVRAPVSSPGEIPYVMFLHDGQIFAGIAAAGEGATRARWSCWVQVADVGAAAHEANKSGGLVVRSPR